MKKLIITALAFLALQLNAQTDIFNHISGFKIGGTITGLIDEDVVVPKYDLDYSRKCYKNFEYEYEAGKKIKVMAICLHAFEIYSILIHADKELYEYFKNKYGVYKSDSNTFVTPSDITGKYYESSGLILLTHNETIDIISKKIKEEKEKESLKEGGL
jgi:hypothetical protein